MREAVLAHCWTGAPNAGWYPAFRDALHRNAWRVRIPALPDSARPDPDKWLDAFADAVGEPHDQMVLVGHSLGCAVVLRYLESLRADTRIGGVVLVAGFSRPLGIDVIDEFHGRDFDWLRLKSRQEPKMLLLGSEDPYLDVPFEVEHFSCALGADVLVLEGQGHFSPASGCTELPQVVQMVQQCLDGRM